MSRGFLVLRSTRAHGGRTGLSGRSRRQGPPVWQVILGLSRYGGLRTPSETLSLRWEDIDWELNRMSIPEPKVEHREGRGVRSCPIFPELRSILDEAFEIFGDKSEFVASGFGRY